MSPTGWSPRIGSSHAPGYRNGRATLGHLSVQDLHCVARPQGNDEPSTRSDGLDTHTDKQKNTYQTGHALGCRQHLRSDRIRKSRSQEFKKLRIREAAIRKLLQAKAGGELLAAPGGCLQRPSGILNPNSEVETADFADLRSRADGLCHLQFCSGWILASDNANLLGLSHLWNL